MTSVPDFARNILIGFVIFVGLPLLAWGVTDLRGFYNDEIRQGYLAMLVLLQVIQILQPSKVKADDDTYDMTVKRQEGSVRLLQTISLSILLITPYCDGRNIAVFERIYWVQVCGLSLIALGLYMMHRAEETIGRLFNVQSAIQEVTRFETDGIYWYMRHPMDLGVIMVTLGMSLAFRSWVGLILTAAITLVMLRCIRDEEREMSKRFEEDWEYHCGCTWALFPRLSIRRTMIGALLLPSEPDVEPPEDIETPGRDQTTRRNRQQPGPDDSPGHTPLDPR